MGNTVSRLRNLVIASSVLVAAVGALSGWIRLAARLPTAGVESLAESASALAASFPTQPAAQGATIDRWIASTPPERRLRILLLRADGTVVADSEPSLGDLSPEVLGSLAQGAVGHGAAHWTGSTRGGLPLAIVAARLAPSAAGTPGVLVLTRTLAEPAVARRQLLVAAGVALVVGLLACGLPAVYAAGRFTSALTRIARRGPGDEPLAAPPGPAARTDPLLAPLDRTVSRVQAESRRVSTTLTAEVSRLESLLDRLPEGVLVADATGKPQRINRQFRLLFGLREAATWDRGLDFLRQPAVAALIERCLAAGGEQHLELLLEHPEPRHLALAAAPLPDTAGVVVVARDVSDLVRLAETRRDFVANVSHELKTPIAAIRGLAETLRDGALEDRDAAPGFLDRILAQCGRLSALLDDLITLSRLESAEASAERHPVDLAELARAALEAVAPAARERGVTLPANPTEPVIVEGEPKALERILWNLLDNAVKYNRRGGRVELVLERRRGEVEIAVSDTGNGIPAEAQTRIFERFYRVDKGRSRDEGGTGLGLAIVKHAAQLHGGKVEVESRLGEGSRFRVRLPVKVEAAGEEPA